MKIPCKECLLIPICRHKPYGDLVDSCEHLYNYIIIHHQDEEHKNRCRILESLMKPTRWELGEESAGGFHVSSKE